LGQDAPGGQQQRKSRRGALVRRHISGDVELALAAHESPHVHGRGAVRRALVAGPLYGSEEV
jgi:hypothetical protein